MKNQLAFPIFQKDKVYLYYYIKNQRARTERHHDYKFRFVGAVKGNGVTHFMFQHVVGGYFITFTERDFLSGEVRMVS